MDLTLQIRKLGLNEYESRAYAALSRLGISSAAQVSRSAAIPRARVYDVLSSLEGKGFAIKRPLKPVVFEALPVGQALQNLARQKRGGLEAELAAIERIKPLLERELKPANIAEKAVEGAWLIEGRGRIYEKMSELIGRARESVVISSSKRGINRKKTRFSSRLEALPKRGVKLEIFTDSSIPRFAVFDRRHVLLFLAPDSSEGLQDLALLINSPQIGSFFSSAAKK